MSIVWLMLDAQARLELINYQWENYGEKLDYPRVGADTTVEPAIESTQEVEILMQQTKKSWK